MAAPLIICPECQGDGKVVKSYTRRAGDIVKVTIPCRPCDGTGWFPRELGPPRVAPTRQYY